MPILDNIRLSQIREAMNYEQNIQRQAFDIIKRGVAVMEPEAPENPPYNQVKNDDVQSVQELVEGMLQMLEKKRNEIDSIIRGRSPQANAENISLVQDVINGYNRIVTALVNPSVTYQTKTALEAQVMKMERNIENTMNMCEKVLNGLLVEPRNVPAITFYFIKILKAYNIYNLIDTQIKSNKLRIITQRDIDENLNKVIRDNGTWFRAVINYRLQAPRYDPIAPGGPPPPPPGGGPGGPGGGPADPGPGRLEDAFPPLPAITDSTTQTPADMGTQTTADMGTQSTFTRKPMQMQTGVSKISIEPVEGAEQIRPTIIGPAASAPSASSRSPMAFPGATRQIEVRDMSVGDSLSEDETPREQLRKERDRYLTNFLNAEFDKTDLKKQLNTIEEVYDNARETHSMASEDRFGKIFRAIDVPKPTAEWAAPTELERYEEAREEPTPDKKDEESEVDSELNVAENEIEKTLGKYHEAMDSASRNLLDIIKERIGSGQDIVYHLGKQVIHIPQEIAKFLEQHPSIVIGLMAGGFIGTYWPESLTTMAYHSVVNSAYSMMGWKAPYVLTEWQRTMQIFNHVVNGGIAGANAEVFTRALKNLARQLGMGYKQQYALPTAKKVGELMNLLVDIANYKSKTLTEKPESLAEKLVKKVYDSGVLKDVKKHKDN
jgi:hypothetical protein